MFWDFDEEAVFRGKESSSFALTKEQSNVIFPTTDGTTSDTSGPAAGLAKIFSREVRSVFGATDITDGHHMVVDAKRNDDPTGGVARGRSASWHPAAASSAEERFASINRSFCGGSSSSGGGLPLPPQIAGASLSSVDPVLNSTSTAPGESMTQPPPLRDGGDIQKDDSIPPAIPAYTVPIWEDHQQAIPRLPVPPLEDTIRLYLKSQEGLLDPESYLATRELAEDFLASESAKSLQKLLLERAASEDKNTSWLEDFWDDAYLCSRDPIPINVNYFFGFQPHPRGASYMTQAGRAASLTFAAACACLSLRYRAISVDTERKAPLCMSQYRRVFCASRVPQVGRDKIISYSSAPLTTDEATSRTCEYVSPAPTGTPDPTHVIIMMRNRLFKIDVLMPTAALVRPGNNKKTAACEGENDGADTEASADVDDDHSHFFSRKVPEVPVPVSAILHQICAIIDRVTADASAGPPVGLFTTLERDQWATQRAHLVELSKDNAAILELVQSALLVVCLDGIRACDPSEHARALLHGIGTNRWFDRHNLIISTNGEAGLNFEHSVGDGTTTLRIADMMFEIDRHVCPSADTVRAVNDRLRHRRADSSFFGTTTSSGTPASATAALATPVRFAAAGSGGIGTSFVSPPVSAGASSVASPTSGNSGGPLPLSAHSDPSLDPAPGSRRRVVDAAYLPTLYENAKELSWRLDGSLDSALRNAFKDFRALIETNDTSVLSFNRYGGNYIKQSKYSPDAFVQLAFQLTYYELFGRCGATYEAASTRGFLHGRTETVRSVTRASADFCRLATTEPIFVRRFGSEIPGPLQQLGTAIQAHVDYMKVAKVGCGVDRHLFGLRMIAAQHNVPLHPFFKDQALTRSTHWRMSTSHCGSPALKLFGFGPVVGDGFGLGYMIKNDDISVVVTSKYSNRLTSSDIFAEMLEASLIRMKCLVAAAQDSRNREHSSTLQFSHPTAFSEFEYDPIAGFRYKARTQQRPAQSK